MAPSLPLALVIAALGLLASPTHACAQRGVLIFGAGDTISHYADANLDGDPELEAALGFEDPAIGYRYEYFSLFFLDLWTGEGELVLYDQATDRYVRLSDEVALDLTGRSAESFGEPFLYRFPLGWLRIGAVLVGAGVSTWRAMRELP